MEILVVGSGGREDALVWNLGQSPLVSKIYCGPGNGGICSRPKTECLSIKADDIFGLADFAQENRIDLTIVGPEAPLVAGISDLFEKRGLKIFGPKKKAAQLEGSKIFAKNFMKKYGIPTADFENFSKPEKAKEYALKNLPIVIKADGLAGGKGVVVCFNRDDVLKAIERLMLKKEFGVSGNRVVVEKFLEGEEATFMILTDGEKFITLLPTQDHKAVFDGDKGENTGGMGAYAPAPIIDAQIKKEVQEKIVKPCLAGLKKERIIYKGCLYFGLMLTKTGPRVLEFNCRFGDPESQPLMMLLESDIVPILKEIAEGKLLTKEIRWRNGAAVCVIMAAGGYPGKYEIGKEIKGLEEAEKMKDVVVFSAGIRKENGILKTAGGRVLGVTARGRGLKEAIALAYQAVAKIHFEGEHHRTDIGKKALEKF
ncbi:phosphoribosylamine--glycine ligase [Patescibacteria group bacterium]|nr:phosphoribosylamine--glycine ligase [Patescibacteria group bacterium]MBU4481224.1 phosphoribosylamine--glycine ligase [Patescibacteria group bacterium]